MLGPSLQRRTMPVIESSRTVASPLGTLRILATDRGITAVEIHAAMRGDSGEQFAFLDDCARQLAEYFEGARRGFTDLPLAVRGTSFQLDVWDALRHIDFGATRTYGELADAVGSPGGAQAVGQALTRNPIAIIVPCHRIIPSDGSLGGYAGGSAAKRWLLNHEGATY